MQVAKQVGDVVTIDDIRVLYPHTSFAADGSDFPGFIEGEEGLYNVNNEIPFDPTTHKLVTCTPYIDGNIGRSVTVIPMTPAEITAMMQRKSGQVIDDYKKEASKCLDEFAQSRGYDNIVSVASYTVSTNEIYQAEALRAVYLRDQWWSTLTGIMTEVLTGQRPLPASWEVLKTELPELTWDNQRPSM